MQLRFIIRFCHSFSWFLDLIVPANSFPSWLGRIKNSSEFGTISPNLPKIAVNNQIPHFSSWKSEDTLVDRFTLCEAFYPLIFFEILINQFWVTQVTSWSVLEMTPRQCRQNWSRNWFRDVTARASYFPHGASHRATEWRSYPGHLPILRLKSSELNRISGSGFW